MHLNNPERNDMFQKHARLLRLPFLKSVLEQTSFFFREYGVSVSSLALFFSFFEFVAALTTCVGEVMLLPPWNVI